MSHNQIRQLPESFGWLISLDTFSWRGAKNTLSNVPLVQKKSCATIRLHFRTAFRQDPATRSRFFSELECQNNIRWKDLSGNREDTNVIIGGNVEKLVGYLAHEEYSSPSFVKCFLFLHQSFCESSELLELLILRYNSGGRELDANADQTSQMEEAASKRKILRIRTLNVLARWLNSHPNHFSVNPQLMGTLSSFVETLPLDPEASSLRSALQNISEGADKKGGVLGPKKETPPKPILPNPMPSNLHITAVDPREIARQACLAECKSNRFVLLQECLICC